MGSDERDQMDGGQAAGSEPAADVAAGAGQASSAGDVGMPDGAGLEQPGQPGDGQAIESDLDELLAQAQRERDEYLSLAQRARADFENFRKRSLADTKDAEIRGKAELAKALIPAVDNLERALLASGIAPDIDGRNREGSEQPSEVVSPHEMLGRGVALVLGELQASLARVGVEAFDPAGETFDPATTEAVSMRPSDDGTSGVVLETLEKGYRIEQRVLRPARVIVGT